MSAGAGSTRIVILVDNKVNEEGVSRHAEMFGVSDLDTVDSVAGQGLVAEHGFSAWIETRGRRLLFDTGQGSALAHNCLRLDVALHSVDTLVLSHGHYDHTGGIPVVVEHAPAAQWYGHPEVTAPRYAVEKGVARAVGMPESARSAFETLSAEDVHWVTQPLEIAPGMGVTGPVPRLTKYEDTGGPFYLDSRGTRGDPIPDDLGMWIRTDCGLVVVVGCSHAGVINTLVHARQVSGEPRLHAVIGGFHLANASKARLERTLEALRELELDLIVPCHCTGDAATERLARTLGERVVPGSSGATYTFPTSWKQVVLQDCVP